MHALLFGGRTGREVVPRAEDPGVDAAPTGLADHAWPEHGRADQRAANVARSRLHQWHSPGFYRTLVFK